MAVMFTYSARFTGGFVAKCPTCGVVSAYWDDDDLDNEGNLHCPCDEEKEV